MEKKLPVDGFTVAPKTAKDLYNNDSVWFDVGEKTGIRISVHAHKPGGVPLTQEDLMGLKKVIDYLVDSDSPTIEGMSRALHPEDDETSQPSRPLENSKALA